MSENLGGFRSSGRHAALLTFAWDGIKKGLVLGATLELGAHAG
jgi:hypothetical protein